MAPRFTHDELDILRHLIEPKRSKALILSVIAERYGLPDWVEKAIEHGWEPPREWHKAEHDRLTRAVNDLVDRGVVVISANWDLRLHSQLSEMDVVAIHALESRPEPP